MVNVTDTDAIRWCCLFCADRFKANPNGVLVATDVMARGLDINQIDHVIHYQIPPTAEVCNPSPTQRTCTRSFVYHPNLTLLSPNPAVCT
jgi:hypothetical protein